MISYPLTPPNLLLIVYYNTTPEIRDDPQSIASQLSKFTTIKYNKGEKADNIQYELFRIFENHIDLNTLEVKMSESSVLNFKKILLQKGDQFTLVCTHKSLRRVIKSFSSDEKFSRQCNLNEYDVTSLMQQKTILILINGTSGSGKSTLSKKLAQRYNIDNILCTDHVRKTMREATNKVDNPILHASTFETGDFLSQGDYDRIYECIKANQSDPENSPVDPAILKEMACVRGYEYQCEIIEDNLIHQIETLCYGGKSLIVEGVHVTESVVNKLFDKYDFCLPFMIYVKNAEEHKQRFGSRCEGGSIDPEKNRYVKNFQNIRAIQRAIKQISINSKFIKTDNDDAKKTFNLITKCIRKYIKYQIEVGLIDRRNLVVSRKRNVLNDIFKTTLQSMEDSTKTKNKQDVTKVNRKSSRISIGNLWVSNHTKEAFMKPWFLRHEKLFHTRTKKHPLV